MWSVASGGRMGQVMGEDAVEVSPAATDCQAQNQIPAAPLCSASPSRCRTPAGSHQGRDGHSPTWPGSRSFDLGRQAVEHAAGDQA